MTREEQQAHLAEAVKQLNGDPRFQEFVHAMRDMRDWVVRVTVADPCVENTNKMLAGLGEIRAYEDILAMCGEYKER
jgi:hypothetical protein